MGEAALKAAGRRGRAIAAIAAAAAVPAAAAALVADGACRDGVPNGAYALRAADGRLRVSGAFAKGVRTGAFLFWSEAGARVAVIPYDDGRVSGTVATWHDARRAGEDPARKSESAFAEGRLHGETRSWYRDGKPRTEALYARGDLVEARAWSAAGVRLPDAQARRLAGQDAATGFAFYATLEAFVDAHRPACP